MIHTLHQIARKTIPASWRKAGNRKLWTACRMSYELRSGIRITLRSSSDWYIFNEIFVEGDYDSTLDMAIKAADGRQPLQIVDIGANVGLFALRAVDRIRASRKIVSFRLTAIEGNPSTAGTLKQNLQQNNLCENVDVFTGLVGRKHGAGFITDYDFCGRNTTLIPHGNGVKSDYLDLSEILSHIPHIDLLKCDIEGSELQFLENYPDILTRVQAAVFEFHPSLCDAKRCEQLLEDAGFRSRVISEKPDAILSQLSRAIPIARRETHP